MNQDRKEGKKTSSSHYNCFETDPTESQYNYMQAGSQYNYMQAETQYNYMQAETQYNYMQAGSKLKYNQVLNVSTCSIPEST